MRMENAGLVYSADPGRMRPSCRKPVAQRVCGTQAPLRPKGDSVVRVGRESQGRGSKTVTVVRGLDLNAVALAALGKQLRAACGVGGTVNDGVLETQGNHCARVIDFMTKRGWQ